MEKTCETLAASASQAVQVDRILGGFSMFWDHMETSVSLLSQRNEHVESLLSFTKNPKLRQRFSTALTVCQHVACRADGQQKVQQLRAHRRAQQETRQRCWRYTSEESRDSVRGRDMSYNFLQLTNSASDDNLSQAASAAAENVAAQGLTPASARARGK